MLPNNTKNPPNMIMGTHLLRAMSKIRRCVQRLIESSRSGQESEQHMCSHVRPTQTSRSLTSASARGCSKPKGWLSCPRGWLTLACVSAGLGNGSQGSFCEGRGSGWRLGLDGDFGALLSATRSRDDVACRDGGSRAPGQKGAMRRHSCTQPCTVPVWACWRRQLSLRVTASSGR